jgi:hypothetical protein
MRIQSPPQPDNKGWSEERAEGGGKSNIKEYSDVGKTAWMSGNTKGAIMNGDMGRGLKGYIRQGCREEVYRGQNY